MGAFRRDLFFRIHVFPIILPSLRSVPENIPGLVQSLLRYLSPKEITVDPAVYPVLARYAWPGNVRELRNVLERAMVLSSGHLTPEHFQMLNLAPPSTLRPAEAAGRKLADLEMERIQEVVARCAGDTLKAAELLGISRATLYRRLSTLKQA